MKPVNAGMRNTGRIAKAFTRATTVALTIERKDNRYKHKLRTQCGCDEPHFPELDCVAFKHVCLDCGAEDGCMPHSCPQRPLSEDERHDISEGRVNYIHGSWIRIY